MKKEGNLKYIQSVSKQRILILFLFIVLFAGISCSTVSLQRAQLLGEQGIEASTTISESYKISAEQVDLYEEGECILAALKEGYTSPSEQTKKYLKVIKEELFRRSDMFDKLSEAYVSFLALSVFNNKEEMEQSLENLSLSIDKYNETIGREYFNTGYVKLFEESVKLFSIEKQKNLIKKTSQLMRNNLESIKTLLEQQKESDSLIAMREEIENNRLKVARTLWKEEIGLPTEIFREHVTHYGLVLNKKKSYPKYLSPETKKAVEEVLTIRHEKKVKSLRESYKASIKAIQSLITAHKSLEEGEGLSLGSINAFLEAIHRYMDVFEDWE